MIPWGGKRMDFKAPYLEAIQGIPGATFREKYRWIVKEIKAAIATGATLEEIVETEKFPRALSPLIQIEAAKILNRTGHQTRSNYEAIAESLKSENWEIVSKALQASEFFDGGNKDITNVDYFSNYLFPDVSYTTRCKIIKKLACSLRKKHPELAEQFFSTILSSYGTDRAMPLLSACSESFIKETVTRHNIVLPIGTITALYKRYPDLVVWYLKLSNPALTDPLKRSMHRVDIREYETFLPRLIKDRLTVLIEIYEAHQESPPSVTLSSTQARLFARKARKYYLERPKIFWKLLRLREISEEDMEIMFPKMFPENVEQFDLATMLDCLKYYPRNKAASLLMKCYENAYGKNLLDKNENITEDLMILLPAEERIKHARFKAEKQDAEVYTDVSKLYYKYVWRCYLPTSEVLPKIREEIARTPEVIDRVMLIGQMLFCCEVNNDYDSLLEVLKYVYERHKNETALFHHMFLSTLQETQDLLRLSKAHWAILFDVIRRMHVKNEFVDCNSEDEKFLITAIHFSLDNGLPIESILQIAFSAMKSKYVAKWYFFSEEPEYARTCLLAVLRLAERERDENNEASWKVCKCAVISSLMQSMYKFNEIYAKPPASKMQPFFVKDFPWMSDEIEKMLQENRKHYILEVMQRTMKKYEPDVYQRLCPFKDDIADVSDTKAVNFLKKDARSVLANWEKYFGKCEHNCHWKSVQRFVRALRWYNDIPVRFLEKCISGITEEKHEHLLKLLPLLVDGETFARFIKPLLPTSKTVDIDEEDAQKKYALINNIPGGMKLANPPVPLDFINKFTEGDYLSIVLDALNNTCKRSSVSKVVPFAKYLSSQRVSVGKHGVRLMDMVASIEQLCEFLSSHWRKEAHYSIRTVVFQKARSLFSKMPNPTTWSLLREMISTITDNEETMLSPWPFQFDNVPDEYLTEYAGALLAMIDRLKKTGSEGRTMTYVASFLRTIRRAECNLLPEEFLEELLRRYLLREVLVYQNPASVARTLLIDMYLDTDQEKLDQRLNVLSAIFVKSVKDGWNEPDKTQVDHLPVNSAVRQLIRTVVFARTSGPSGRMIINRMMAMFLRVLTHKDDPRSFILLSYANEWVQAETQKDSARRIGEKLRELVELYTPFFSHCLAVVLTDFLKFVKFTDRSNEDVAREILEILADAGTTEASFVSVEVLSVLRVKADTKDYLPLLEKLGKAGHPAVESLINYIRE